jgi:hypothetical protein
MAGSSWPRSRPDHCCDGSEPCDAAPVQTIPQTLGAACAVLAALVIYRLHTGIFTFSPAFEKLRTDFHPNRVLAGTRPVAS